MVDEFPHTALSLDTIGAPVDRSCSVLDGQGVTMASRRSEKCGLVPEASTRAWTHMPAQRQSNFLASFGEPQGQGDKLRMKASYTILGLRQHPCRPTWNRSLSCRCVPSPILRNGRESVAVLSASRSAPIGEAGLQEKSSKLYSACRPPVVLGAIMRIKAWRHRLFLPRARTH
jgi:hypothetical protein